MRKVILLTMSLLTSTAFCSYSQNWLWANSGGGANIDGAGSMCLDQNGNTFITGNVQEPTAYFQTDTFSVNGFNDIFLAKYDGNGNEVWVKHFGGIYNNTFSQKVENGQVVTYNATTNSIYLIGIFVGSCAIDSITLFANSPIDQQIFIAKFDLNGNCIWAKSAGSAGNDYAIGLTTSQLGKIYISGTTKYNATFDTINIANGGFIAMYNDNGNCQWVKNIFGGSNSSTGASGSPMSLRIFNNDIFMIGQKNSDTVYVDTILFTGANYYPNILARFDSSGNAKWAKQLGGPNAYYGYLSMDDNGNCYFGSQFKGGYAVLETDTVYSTGATDFFFVKYDPNGNFQWVSQCNATVNARAIGCSADGDGNVYLTGSFSGNATFGTFNISANTSEDFFLARYDTDGNCLGVRHGGQAVGYDVSTYENGNCVVVGKFKNSVSLGSSTLFSNGYDDIFVAKTEAITGVGNSSQRMSNNNQLLIYSNLATGKCNITIPDDFQEEKNLTLYIYESSGKLIQQVAVTSDSEKLKMNIEEEAKGTYNIVLSNGNKNYSGKIIFE
jgi:hypothetical protein